MSPVRSRASVCKCLNPNHPELTPSCVGTDCRGQAVFAGYWATTPTWRLRQVLVFAVAYRLWTCRALQTGRWSFLLVWRHCNVGDSVTSYDLLSSLVSCCLCGSSAGVACTMNSHIIPFPACVSYFMSQPKESPWQIYRGGGFCFGTFWNVLECEEHISHTLPRGWDTSGYTPFHVVEAKTASLALFRWASHIGFPAIQLVVDSKSIIVCVKTYMTCRFSYLIIWCISVSVNHVFTLFIKHINFVQKSKGAPHGCIFHAARCLPLRYLQDAISMMWYFATLSVSYNNTEPKSCYKQGGFST